MAHFDHSTEMDSTMTTDPEETPTKAKARSKAKASESEALTENGLPAPRTHSLWLERFEGRGKTLAILTTKDQREVVMPRVLLPKGTKAGQMMILHLEIDPKTSARVAERGRHLQRALDKTEPDGDVVI